MSPRRHWDSPNPSLASERVCPPLWTKRGGTTLACGWGVGGVPIPTTGEKLSNLPTLWVSPNNVQGLQFWKRYRIFCCRDNPASTEKFFFEFWSDFSVCFPLGPLVMRYERKNLLSLPEVWFLDATRFVRLVLTWVHVANFFNIAHFDLIFLHSVQINI